MPYDYMDEGDGTYKDNTAVKKSWAASVIAVLVAIVLALGGWLMFSKSDSAVKTKATIEDTVKSAKDKTVEETKKLEDKVKP